MRNTENDILLRLKHVLGIIPISKVSWYAGIQSGRYPKPIKLGRCSFWKKSSIIALIEKMERGEC